MNKLTDAYTLNNGVEIPCIGFGTWQTPSGETAKNSVIAALKHGYRHIDTAAIYGNEESVGDGMKAGGISREEIFLTTKHWVSERGYEKTIAAAEASLKRLKTDYLDLYLIHWPAVEKADKNWKETNASTWRGFEKLYRDGKIRAIGVSNFLPEHLAALSETAEIRPTVNQIEFHPGYCQWDCVNWCREHDILVEAWSPLGCGRMLGDKTLKNIAEKYGKTVAQICIKFALQSGVLPLPKSTHEDRIASNTKVFDFMLSDEDMSVITAMPPSGMSGFYPEEAPADSL
jgi:diketogulonate reductase-like aldo/keto reductase